MHKVTAEHGNHTRKAHVCTFYANVWVIMSSQSVVIARQSDNRFVPFVGGSGQSGGFKWGFRSVLALSKLVHFPGAAFGRAVRIAGFEVSGFRISEEISFENETFSKNSSSNPEIRNTRIRNNGGPLYV